MLSAAAVAADITLDEIRARSDPAYSQWIATWPGEHYRLLAGLVHVERPRAVVEIGTFKGHSALALLAGSEDVRVITYDVVPWDETEGAVLQPLDFETGRLEQRIGDIAETTYRDEQLETLRQADMVFVDGPKDGRWEERFCRDVLPLLTDRPRLLVFDDIRLLEMVQLWRDLPYAKLDATSVGHWSGTGLARLG